MHVSPEMIAPEDDWEVALLGEPYARGLCTVLGCDRPATYTDAQWAASGHEPYRCADHASGVHVLAAPSATDVSFSFDELTALLLPACGLTETRAYQAALMRDALPTPRERLVERRAKYAQHVNGMTWDALTGEVTA